MRLRGNYIVGPRSIRVAREEGGPPPPSIYCHPSLATELARDHSIDVEVGFQLIDGKRRPSVKWGPDNQTDPAVCLLFYAASHPRQRLSRRECKGVTLVKVGGNMVIAIAATDALLVFRYREFVERVFFDGDSIRARITQEEAQL